MRSVTQSTLVVGQGSPGLAGLRNRWDIVAAVLLVGLVVVIGSGTIHNREAQAADPTMLDPNLAVRTVVAGLDQPTSMAFLGRNDILMLEKATGKVQRVVSGVRITQAHVHCAPAGVNGPIVVFLAGLHAAGLDVDGKWVSNATITDTSIVNTTCGATVSALAESMHTGNTYANVHSVAHPAGVVRGQIEPAD